MKTRFAECKIDTVRWVQEYDLHNQNSTAISKTNSSCSGFLNVEYDLNEEIFSIDKNSGVEGLYYAFLEFSIRDGQHIVAYFDFSLIFRAYINQSPFFTEDFEKIEVVVNEEEILDGTI
jgi:hypothetical protein